MGEIGAALLATAFSYVVNRWGITRFGLAEVMWVGPVMEEVAKTGMAWILDTAVWPVHLYFGTMEGLLDIRTGASHRYGAALVSLAGHSIFGYATLWGTRAFSSIAVGMMLGIGIHVLWNSYVIVFLVKR
jgi:hypothetical protein